MRYSLVLTAVLAVTPACFSVGGSSSAGAFVTNLRFANGAFEVERCELVHTKTTTVVLVPYIAGVSTAESTTQEGCKTTSQPVVYQVPDEKDPAK